MPDKPILISSEPREKRDWEEEIVVKFLRNLINEVKHDTRIAALAEVKKVLCQHCAGKSMHWSGVPQEGVNPVPVRQDEDKYIANYGSVKKGEWLHHSAHGEKYCCAASKIWEFEVNEE